MKIWDRFLTDQDRALASSKSPSRIGYGKNPALLLIDLYRWVFGDKPAPVLQSIKSWPASCGLAGWNALPDITKLLTAARDARVPVIHVAMMYDEESGVEEWYERGTDRPRGDKVKSRYEIIEELKPIAGEVVLRKSAPSAFWGTPLVAHLTALGIDTIIVTGETTSGCIRASVVDGRTYGYRMIVPEECVFDRTEASHAINLFDMDQKYADVVALSEVINYLFDLRRDSASK